jgi:hypothetical protein
MYKCENCGAEFDIDDVEHTFDMDGKETSVCPICQIDNLFETRECACGNACEENKLICIYCTEELNQKFDDFINDMMVDYNLEVDEAIIVIIDVIEGF